MESKRSFFGRSYNVSRASSAGSVLVCVLVVMLVAGLLAMQGMRLLMATGRGQQEQARLQQAQALIQLGRIRMAELADRNSTEPGASLDESFRVEFRQKIDGEKVPGHVRILKQAGRADNGWRIEARYPYNQPGEIVASWESEP